MRVLKCKKQILFRSIFSAIQIFSNFSLLSNEINFKFRYDNKGNHQTQKAITINVNEEIKNRKSKIVYVALHQPDRRLRLTQ